LPERGASDHDGACGDRQKCDQRHVKVELASGRGWIARESSGKKAKATAPILQMPNRQAQKLQSVARRADPDHSREEELATTAKQKVEIHHPP